MHSKVRLTAVGLALTMMLAGPVLAWHGGDHSQPERFQGSSQQLGPFRYDNYQGDQGTQIQGTGQRIGPFQYDTFRDNYGNTVNCTTQHIGNQAYTNCY